MIYNTVIFGSNFEYSGGKKDGKDKIDYFVTESFPTVSRLGTYI